MRQRTLLLISITLSGLALLAGSAGICLADDLGTSCAAAAASVTGCPNQTMSSDDCEFFLRKCADYYDQQSTQISQDIKKTSQKKNTLQNAISQLKNKILSQEAAINQTAIETRILNMQISVQQNSIDGTNAEINDLQNQIAAILRSIDQASRKSNFLILLEGDFSDFFSNLAYFYELESKLTDILDKAKNLKSQLADQQAKITDSADQMEKTLAMQAAQQQDAEKNQQQQKQYLNLTEAQYQKQLATKKADESKSAKIKALLFQIVGVSKAPTFGEALDAAKSIAALENIRPAFLLAIISQESAIGKNVGQCVLTDSSTGNGQKISNKAAVIRVMKPTRDIQPFIQLTAALGRDPYKTPVSCWIPAYVGGVPSGWGGAMGPAQFIASTWNGLAGTLKNLLGRTADPWEIKDSFTAAALYLSNLGASAQTAAAESATASRYYGGSAAYARSVMTRENCIQAFIDSNTMSADCQSLIF